METPEIKLPHGTLSEVDLDVLSGMMIIFLKSAEKCIQLMELHYQMEYMAGKEYRAYCKLYGKPATDAIVKQQVQKIIRGDDRNRLGKILKAAEEMHKQMDYLVDSGMQAHSADINDGDAFNAMQHDTNFLCYLYALMANCIGKDDELKLISTVKAMAKGDRVSENVLDKLKIQ